MVGLLWQTIASFASTERSCTDTHGSSRQCRTTKASPPLGADVLLQIKQSARTVAVEKRTANVVEEAAAIANNTVTLPQRHALVEGASMILLQLRTKTVDSFTFGELALVVCVALMIPVMVAAVIVWSYGSTNTSVEGKPNNLRQRHGIGGRADRLLDNASLTEPARRYNQTPAPSIASLQHVGGRLPELPSTAIVAASSPVASQSSQSLVGRVYSKYESANPRASCASAGESCLYTGGAESLVTTASVTSISSCSGSECWADPTAYMQGYAGDFVPSLNQLSMPGIPAIAAARDSKTMR